MSATAGTLGRPFAGPRSVQGGWLGRAFVVFCAVAIAAVMAKSPVTRLPFFVLYAVLCIRWPLERVFTSFVFLSIALDDPSGRPFRDLWKSPIQDIGFTWFSNISTAVPGVPIKISPLALVAFAMAFRAATQRTGPNWAYDPTVRRIPALYRSALAAGLGAVVFSSLWGIARHGNKQQLYYQVTPILIAFALIVTAMTLANVDLARRLRKVILVAAAYRAFTLVFVWFTKIRHLPALPRYATLHSDSVLWATALIIIVSQFLEHPSRRTRRALLLWAPLLCFSIVINNRRLAWVMLLVAVIYVCLSSVGTSRARLSKMLPLIGPVLGAYVLIGLAAPPSLVFAPVQAVESVVNGEDSSSETRQIENINLVFTMRETAPFGAGFGQPYTELISGGEGVANWFPNYDYQPHNSLFGYLMWMGPIGLALAMGPICLAIRAAHLTRARTSDPFVRTTCVLAIAVICFYFLEGFADFGLQTSMSITLSSVLGGMVLGLSLEEQEAQRASGRVRRSVIAAYR
jgi:hypothetical protein